jgi:hypothetical protein
MATAVENPLYSSQGMLLVEVPGVIPVVARVLKDKSVLEAYKEGIQRYGARAREVLDVFSYDSKEGFVGSGVFPLHELKNYLPEGTRMASFKEIVDISTKSLNLPRPRPIICANSLEFVLRRAGDSKEENDHIAKDLAKQIGKRWFRTPVKISGLTIKEDDDSYYGLSFKTTDETEIIKAPQFAYRNNGRRFLRVDENSLPIFGRSGRNILFVKKGDISLLSVNGNSAASRGYMDSFKDGPSRVIVVSSENLDISR